MLGYRARGVFTTLTLCAALLVAACGEDFERISRSQNTIRGDEQLGLIPRGSEGEGAGLVAGADRRMSAAVLVGDEDPGQQQSHRSPEQRRRRTQTGCEESSPFSITSSLSSDFEGCYFRSEVPIGDDGSYELIYTQSGTPEVGQMWMHPDAVEIDGVQIAGIYWWLAFVTAVDEYAVVTAEYFCVSLGQPATTFQHPGDVTSWYCGEMVSATEFSTTCGGGCPNSPSPTEPEPSPTPEPPVEIPEPTEAEAPEPTDPATAPESSCEESSPFSITSSFNSDFEGCYFPTEVPFGDGGFFAVVYTPSGTPEVGQMWIHPGGIENYEGTYWWLSFATAVDENVFVTGENFCHSYGQPFDVYHPGDVTSWYCGGLSAPPTAGVSSVCDGSCSNSPSPSEPEPLLTPEPAVETPEPTEAETTEPAEAKTPGPTQPATPETVPPLAATPEPSSGSRELENTSSPSADGSPGLLDDDASRVPAGTPAPDDQSDKLQSTSAGHRCAAWWSVSGTCSASVVAAFALAAAW